MDRVKGWLTPRRTEPRAGTPTESDSPSAGAPPDSGRVVSTRSEPSPSFPDGVKVWHDCPDAEVDVCFVHGLTGNRDTTWTAAGQTTPWPATLLPPKLPRARLLTYGYDAYVLRSSAASQNRLLDHATSLLTDLTDDRASHQASSRPIIFVAHSFGGLVCKEAVFTSRNNAELHLRDVFDHTIGVIFMGTPHRGAWMAGWAKIPVPALGLVKSTNKSLLTVLQTNDQMLESVQIRFWSMVRELRESGRHFEITCFFEELPLPVVGKVVSKDSATLEGFLAVSIHANHSDMVKFDSVEQNGFKRLLGTLTRWQSQTLPVQSNQDEIILAPQLPTSQPSAVTAPTVPESTVSTSARPTTRRDFEIVIICALPLEADAVNALFDHHWDDDGPPYDKALGDTNAYSTGAIGRHNVVLAHMPGMNTINAATVASNCRISFPNIKLALVIGICGAIPFTPDGREIVLGDVIISDGVVQYDFGRQLPDGFERKDTLLDSLGRPNVEIRGHLNKLKLIRERQQLQQKIASSLNVLRKEPELAAEYPGAANDVLFEATYRHVGGKGPCKETGCDGQRVSRSRLEPGRQYLPEVHFGLIASGDTVMKSGEHRDTIAAKEGVIALEMESAGVWDVFPCIVIKGVCDYADSHKSKGWQRYAAATAAAGMKAFLDKWTPTVPTETTPNRIGPSLRNQSPTSPRAERAVLPCHYIPFPKNNRFVGREAILGALEYKFLSKECRTTALVGLGGIGKTQVALRFAYWAKEHSPNCSVFWIPALSMSSFEQTYDTIAARLGIERSSEGEDIKDTVRQYLMSPKAGEWIIIVDNADDMDIVFGTANQPGITHYLPETETGFILYTTRSRDVAVDVTDEAIDLEKMSQEEGIDFLTKSTARKDMLQDQALVVELLCELSFLPLAISQAVAYLNRNRHTSLHRYLELLRGTERDMVSLMSREFRDPTRYKESQNAVATTWLVSFEQIRSHDIVAAKLLSFLSCLEPKAIPRSILPGALTEEVENALGTLSGYAFLTQRGNSGIWDMHNLVHLSTRIWTKERSGIIQVVDDTVRHINVIFPLDDYRSRNLWREYMPHAMRLLRHAEESDIIERDELSFWVGRCLKADGRIREAVGLLEKTVKWQRKRLEEDHPDRLASQNNLASAYEANGQIKEAVELLEHVVSVQKTLAEDHPHRLASQHTLASAYEANGQIKEAVELLEHVVSVQKTLAEDHPDRLTSQHALASAYEADGQIKEAVELLEHVVSVREKTLAEDQPDLLASQNDLAYCYIQAKRVPEAVALLNHIIEVNRKVSGEDDPRGWGCSELLSEAYEKLEAVNSLHRRYSW